MKVMKRRSRYNPKPVYDFMIRSVVTMKVEVKPKCCQNFFVFKKGLNIKLYGFSHSKRSIILTPFILSVIIINLIFCVSF